MRRKTLSVFTVFAVALVSVAAFADAPANYTWTGAPTGYRTSQSTVNFAFWMEALSKWSYSGSLVYAMLDPTSADNNQNFVPDVTELAVIQAICNDTGRSDHDTVHNAYKANFAQFGTDMGSLGSSLSPPLKYVIGAYALLGDGYYVPKDPRSGGIQEAVGSFGFVAGFIEGMSDYGSLWSSGAPDVTKYNLQPTRLSVSGDADSDGVGNAYEFYGQSMNQANYVAAVLNPAITTCGTGPG